MAGTENHMTTKSKNQLLCNSSLGMSEMKETHTRDLSPQLINQHRIRSMILLSLFQPLNHEASIMYWKKLLEALPLYAISQYMRILSISKSVLVFTDPELDDGLSVYHSFHFLTLAANESDVTNYSYTHVDFLNKILVTLNSTIVKTA